MLLWVSTHSLGIYPSIVEHEIWTYPDAKPVWQKLRPVNLRKAAAVKAKVEKLLKAGFIYPIALTEWVSNPILVDKKHGMISICTQFQYLNKSCPKDNYPTPFINQIIDTYVGSEVFSFIDGFTRYNQIQIKSETNIKQLSSILGVHLRTRKCPLDWKMQGLPFNG